MFVLVDPEIAYGTSAWERGTIKVMSHGPQAAVPAAIAELARHITEASERIRPVVTQTPVEKIEGLITTSGIETFFKLENFQQTGSFKLRGASNKILSLSPQQAALGVIAASNGNHGLGVAAAAVRAGITAEVYVSSHVSP